MNVKVIDAGTQRDPASVLNFQKDLLFLANSNMYINEKGYLQKLLELLFETGYYNNNESYFTRKG